MKLRTQLVIVFILLAIVPLAGIVVYSYYSSQKAFRQAVEKETRSLATQMDTRMAGIREDLDRRFERIGGLPLDTLLAASAPGAASSGDAAARLAAELGDSAEFLDQIEWLSDRPAEEIVTLDTVVAPVAPVPPVAPAPPSPVVAEVPASPEAASSFSFVISIPRVEVDDAGNAVIVGSETKTITAPTGLDTAEIDVSATIAQAQRFAKEARRELAREHAELRDQRREQDTVLRELRTKVVHKGSDFGVLTAKVREDEIVKKVLHAAAPETDDIAFAINEGGTIFTSAAEDRERLAGLDVASFRRGEPSTDENWVVATSRDEKTGLTFGVARPVSDSLGQMRASAVNNFMWGLSLIALALFGIVPVANHLTRDIGRVMEGVDRIGNGDLDSPVHVRSSNEIGQLGAAFNRMALDLKDHQTRLLDEERRRREREVEQRVFEAEYRRKSSELEEARDFQLSLLPSDPPTHPDLDIAVFVRTATEVGGDYYDYHLNEDGSLTIAVGDATGHGARAGTMVTVVKSLFAGNIERAGLADFLDEGNRTIRQMKLERMAMALTVGRYRDRRFELAAAGMPPALVYRASSGAVDELQCDAPPLGTLAHDYQSVATDLAEGDLVLMMTDGFPELANADGEPLGYEAMGSLFRDIASSSPQQILQAFADEADRWTQGQPPSDDITFLAIRVRTA